MQNIHRIKFREDIQALRAVAILAVLFYHLTPTSLTGGFMGVDVFFVISGYLMTLTIWKGIVELHLEDRALPYRNRLKVIIKFLLDFYSRRILRLLPAAFVLLAFVLATIHFIGDPKIQLDTTRQVFASIFLVQNWYLANEAVDYLGADAQATAVQHFWSLSVEEQFYLFWPMLLLIVGYLAYKLFSKRNHPKVNINKTFFLRSNFILLFFIVLFTVSSFIYCLKITQSNPAEAYFVTPARIWELSLGGIIVFLPKLNNRYLRFILPWLGLGLIMYPIIKWGGEGFPGWRALLPTLGTALVIWAGMPTEGSSGATCKVRFFSLAYLSGFKPFQFFGNISYSLYLWHWPIIIFVPILLGIQLDSNSDLTSTYHIILFLMTVALAWISYTFIELPAKRIGIAKTSTAKVWLLAGVSLALIAVPAKLIELNANDYTANIVHKAFKRAVDSRDIGFGARATQHRGKSGVPSNPFGVVDRTWSQFASTHVHGTIDSKDKGVDLSGSMTYSCDSKSKRSHTVVGEFGDLTSDKILLVLGDSFSKHWYPAIDIAARKLGYKVIAANSIYSNGSLFEMGNEFGETWTYGKGNTISISRSNKRYNWIRENLWNKATAIIIGISPACFTQTNKNPQSLRDAPARLAATLNQIYKQTGNKAILIQSPPTRGGSISSQKGPLGYNIGELILSNSKSGNSTNKPPKSPKPRMNLTYDSLVKIGATDSFHYLKLEDIFLDENGYSHTHIGGIPVFYDDGHINTLFSASAGEYFATQLDNILSKK